LGPVINAVAPYPVVQKELLREVAAILKRPFFLPNIPGWVLKMVLGEMSAVVLESQKVHSAVLESADFQFKYTAIQPALSDLLKR